jgi:hypothetical protein
MYFGVKSRGIDTAVIASELKENVCHQKIMPYNGGSGMMRRVQQVITFRQRNYTDK